MRSFLVVLLFSTVHCQNDYHNLLNRYHELMKNELLSDIPVSSPFRREEQEGERTFVPPSSSFHSLQSHRHGLDGGDMRMPRGL
ncbi:hypothetical protein PFISCL1PPCAC_6132, partial [Pristionchus fissidentatus]